MELKIVTLDGTAAGTVDLPDTIFGRHVTSFGAGLDVEDHFGIGEIGKSDLAIMTERLGAEMCPEIHQPVLRLTVDFPEPLALDVVDARLHQLE